MGTPDFSVPVLQRLIDDGYTISAVVTQPDRPKGRKKVLTASPVKHLAETYGLPVLQPEKVRAPEAVEEILSYHPDILITAAYGQILPSALLDAPPLGAINVHASLLPKYRGAAPIQQAIIDGEKETGVTIMYMVQALDAGDMLAQAKVPIEDQDTFGTLHDKLSALGSDLLARTLLDLEKGKIKPVPQNDSEATVAPSIKHKDEAINWTKSGKDVCNLIRGLNPFPGAYTLLNGKVFKIYAVENVTPDYDGAEAPGTVTKVDKDGFAVACGGGAVKVIECQPSGKKRMTAEQFLRGRALASGTVLGS